jgi:hypothetical protein
VVKGSPESQASKFEADSLPFLVCKGRRRYLLATVREHLIRNRRHLDFRVWRGPGSRDSSDDEWDEHFWAPTAETTREVDV